MVSLEQRSSYLKIVNDSIILKSFHDFLMEKKINNDKLDNISQINDDIIKLIYSIQNSNKELFEKIYNRRSKSSPNQDSQSPFINNDFFIFSLLVGIKKFNIDKEWIKKIISIRSNSQIAITFSNILKEDFYSKSNLSEIILMYLKLTDNSFISNEFINKVYTDISGNSKLFDSKFDFQILCAINAYDYIVMLKEAPDGSRIYLLNKFENKFVKRIKILTWIIQICLFSLIFYILSKLKIYSPEIVELIEKYEYIFVLISAFGFTILGNSIPKIKNICRNYLMLLFGYPKKMIPKSK
ncbi:MAG: hypothetical protein ACK5M0_05040 [Bacteroidales bacterium]